MTNLDLNLELVPPDSISYEKAFEIVDRAYVSTLLAIRYIGVEDQENCVCAIGSLRRIITMMLEKEMEEHEENRGS